MNEINKLMNEINKQMDEINKHVDNINKEIFYERVYSFTNYYHIDNNIFGCKHKNNILITEKKCIEKLLSSLESINMNLLRYIHFLNKQYCVINITHNNTINFLMQNKLQLKQLLDKLAFVYNNNLYNINLITKKINIINLTTTMFTPFYNV